MHFNTNIIVIITCDKNGVLVKLQNMRIVFKRNVVQKVKWNKLYQLSQGNLQDQKTYFKKVFMHYRQ